MAIARWLLLLVAIVLAAPFAADPCRAQQDRPAPAQPDRAERMQAIRGQAPPSLRSWIEDLPPSQRRLAVRRLRRMNDAQRARFFTRWEGLSTSEREAFQERMQRQSQRRQPAQRQRRAFAENLARWNELGDADRQEMRKRLDRFQGLSATQQEALVERNFAARSAEERAQILDRLRNAGR